MIDDINPAKESGPEVLKISRRNPVAAEEENNFAKITGSTSFGIFKSLPIGVKKLITRFKASEERKI